MAAHRRSTSLFRTVYAALLLALALGACHAGDGPAEETPSAAPPAPERTGVPTPQQLPTADAPSEEPSGTGTPGEAGTRRAPVTATEITGIWPDGTWALHEELEGDACGDSPPVISRWALGQDYFTCGAPEDRLLACKQESDDRALCVRDPMEKTAVRIRSPGIEGFTAPAPEDPLPLMVILADGTTCAPVPRDDLEHHAGRQSWMHCGEGAALLLDLTTASRYFEVEGAVWTVDLGVGRSEPVEVEVREVLYAGTPEDVAAQGFTAG
ncbi:hypothetical protein [Brachybacterium saurashtrense]|uniref:Uncharacterized protein n=1 Tax=Brachybacterium saurashtrense TaxID=556288 RepID=A0A345YS53_9MICO|nr:hypothetical protein [Brachybacterium saurashtrense]AXK46755.1 hypothetical protein DWV08_14800 [Brachybacterium saurashtrense]RRR22470.1 hypothetical protein DXU92_09420 [Brachybacterium saurashtrense]